MSAASDSPAASKLTIVAHITARPGQADFVKAELQKVIPLTLAEAGCLQYDLHQDNQTPEQFLFYENWTTRALWQDHMQSDHIAAMRAATQDAVAETTIYEMTPCS